MKERLLELVDGFSPEWATFILAMTPVGEVRASVPVGIGVYDLPVWEVFALSVLGNVLVGALAMLVMLPVISYLIKHWPTLHRVWEKYIHRLETKNAGAFEKWGSLALILFVAVPLPMTGIYSGAIAASIFQIPFRRAIVLLGIGSIIATAVMTLLTVSVRGAIIAS